MLSPGQDHYQWVILEHWIRASLVVTREALTPKATHLEKREKKLPLRSERRELKQSKTITRRSIKILKDLNEVLTRYSVASKCGTLGDSRMLHYIRVKSIRGNILL